MLTTLRAYPVFTPQTFLLLLQPNPNSTSPNESGLKRGRCSRDVIPGFLAIPKFRSFPDSFQIPDTSRNGMRNDKNAGMQESVGMIRNA